MPDNNKANLSAETTEQIGLRPLQQGLNTQMAPDARVFEYPGLESVYVMESDLYGNTMPEGSCFLAFNGRAGMIGTHITIDTLKNSTVADIQKIVADNKAG